MQAVTYAVKISEPAMTSHGLVAVQMENSLVCTREEFNVRRTLSSEYRLRKKKPVPVTKDYVPVCES